MEKREAIIKRMSMRSQTSVFSKMFLKILLGICLVTIISATIENVLIDLGISLFGEIRLGWWRDTILLSEKFTDSEYAYTVFSTRPNTFWMFTQFTWLTTFATTLFLFFKIFNYDSESTPKWLRWINSPRTLAMLSSYEAIVMIVFWIGIFSTIDADVALNNKIWIMTLINTIFVHAVIPVLLFIYNVFHQIYGRDCSLMREKFVVKGMIYPCTYLIIYIVVAITWFDPYFQLTNLLLDFWESVGKIVIAMFSVYLLLGSFLVLNNFLLLKFNKNYSTATDPMIEFNRKQRIHKLELKAKKEFKNSKKYKEIKDKIDNIDGK